MAQPKRRHSAKRIESVGRMESGAKQPARREKTCVVKGTVRRADGGPCAGVLVRAYDKDLRKMQLLDRETTRADGSYAIQYAARKFREAEKRSADLYVSVVDAKGKTLVTSDILFNAPAQAIIDLTLPAEPEQQSEFELLVNAILPLLKGQGKGKDLLIAELEENDFPFLAKETGQPKERIAFLVAATHASSATCLFSGPILESHVSKANRPGIPPEVFYGWFRQNLPTSLPELLSQNPKTLRQALKISLRDNIIPRQVGTQIETIFANWDELRLSHVLAPAEEGTRPSLGDLLGLLKGKEALEPEPAKRFALLQTETTPGDDLWRKAARTLSPTQVAGLQSVFALDQIVEGDPSILRQAKAYLQKADTASAPSPLLQVAAMDVNDWRHVLRAAKTPCKDNDELTQRAREHTKRTAALMPVDFMLVRAARQPETGELKSKLSCFDKLRKLNGPHILARSFDELELRGIAAAQREHVQADWQSLVTMVNRYPGLQLDQVLEKDGSSAQKADEIKKRIGCIEKVYAQNPELDFLSLDYLPDSKDLAFIKTRGLKKAEKGMVLRTLKAFQRVFRAAGNAFLAMQVLESGFDSSTAIADQTLAKFAEISRLSLEEAYPIYEAAKDRAIDAELKFMGIYDYVQKISTSEGHAINSLNPTAEVYNYLRKLDGFEQMFGRQAMCKCKDCNSVLSPAAYFVDLMRFIDKHVTSTVFTGGNANHPLKLQTRRPDLWNLELTCENTNKLIPSLDIINEILENGIAKGLSPIPNGRADIQKAVYKELAKADNSFQQPFNLPLHRLESYLTHFDRTRADVARALGVDDEAYTRAKLSLSLKEQRLIAPSTSTTSAFLTGLYGGEIVQSLVPQTEVDIQEFLKRTRWTRDELGQLLASEFVRSANAITIRSKKRDANSIQNDVEIVKGLDLGVLDRLHRFTRLWRKLPWTIAELDQVLFHLRTGNSPELTTSQLKQIASLLDIQKRFSAPVEELCALIADFPKKGVGANQPLFDRLFNLEPFVTQDGPWSSDPLSGAQNPTFVHPALAGGTSQPNNRILQRLLAGLQIDDQELIDLIIGLGLASSSSPGLALTPHNLVLLYRHARLARLLKSTVPQLQQLLELGKIGASAKPFQVNTLADLVALLRFFDQWQASGFDLDDLGSITGGPVLKPERYPDPSDVAERILAGIRAERAVEFDDTVFVQLPKVTEAESRAFIRQNSSAFEQVTESQKWRLKTNFDPLGGALTVPSGTVMDKPKIRQLLDNFHPRGILPSRIAAQFDISKEKLLALAKLTSNTGNNILTTHSSALVAELQPNAAPGSTQILEGILESLLPLATLFRSDTWDDNSIKFVADYPGILALTSPVDPTKIAVATIFRVAAHVRLTAVPEEGLPERPQPNVQAVQSVLGAGVVTASLADMAASLRVPESSIAALRPHLIFGTDPFEGLDRLSRCLELTTYLGVSGETLKMIVPSAPTPSNLTSDAEYDALLNGAEGLYGVFRAKYPDEKTFFEKIEAFDDQIRGRRRDGLVEYLIRSAHKGFESPNDLFQYFLIDTQLEGCARTSRVVAANSSLQLYVHRILMNLEQSSEQDPRPIQVKPDCIPDEWAWRKHYRVWEANRKVFLYPENYLEPELRDDKTPLFEELESTLHQQTINEQNVTDAYANYLTGYGEVATLSIAGAFHDISSDRDILHLIGVTRDDPPMHYYRTIENIHSSQQSRNPNARVTCSPWRRIPVQIPVRQVTPVKFHGTLLLFWWSKTASPWNFIRNGTNEFLGYKHKMSLNYCTLRTDGSWTSAQKVSLDPTFLPFDEPNLIVDRLVQQLPKYRPVGDSKPHSEAVESYALSGARWDRPFVERDNTGLFLAVWGYDETRLYAALELASNLTLKYSGFISWANFDRVFHVDSTGKIYCGIVSTTGKPFFLSPLAMSTMLATTSNIKEATRDTATGTPNSQFEANTWAWLQPKHVATVSALYQPELIPLNGSPENAIVQTNSGIFLLTGSRVPFPQTSVSRLSTSTAEKLQTAIASGGLDGLLSVKFQNELKEDVTLVPNGNDVMLRYQANQIDFSGPYGTYFREVLFHIPFLIANHLNSQQLFPAAQRWYHYLFNPTSPDTDRDRVWRYREFRGLELPDLRKALTDDAALEAYRRDPFNPHAIARLRLSAYQKAIVMKYIDNLLDWGDSLFAEFTMESVNEATMLYIMAADILGPRPADVGDCGEGEIQPKTYENIAPKLKADSEFLIELEHLEPVHPYKREKVGIRFLGPSTVTVNAFASTAQPASETGNGVGATTQPQLITGGLPPSSAPAIGTAGPTTEGPSNPLDWQKTRQSYWTSTHGTDLRTVGTYGAARDGNIGNRYPAGDGRPMPRVGGEPDFPPAKWGGPDIPPDKLKAFDSRLPSVDRKPWEWNPLERPGDGLIRPKEPVHVIPYSPDLPKTCLVFCMPENKELRSYWDRVENRLFNIRNCMDITGARRQLSLFAPETDPRLLVRARAAGLSLEDVLNVTNGSLPPYRFTFLIEKAKQYASAVQGLGSALLSALEKKDAEELNRLRAVHEQNLLKLRTLAQEWEIKTAEDTLASLERQREAVEYRKGYYEGLLQTGLSAWEFTQQVSRHVASGLHATEAILGMLAGTFNLLPQLGSPFAMKYGGMELGNSAHRFAVAVRALADVSETVSASAGLEATFQRRDEEWTHQQKLAEKELANLDKQIRAAQIRVDIARQSLEVHNKTIEQAEEVFDFYRDKFSSFGLYTWLSTHLHRLYRDAFNSAFAVAKMTEQAFRFERQDDAATLLNNSYWVTSQAGLLAGERLLLDLQNLERRFLETNYRTPEIEQSFSLMQFEPSALLDLRQTGECEFTIPEVSFDMTYPGHYRRRIKAARLTIPCVTGPHTNAGATLRLLRSWIRQKPETGNSAPVWVEIPLRHTTSISTSTSQNDAGVFDFNLRDERYMPFEGAGAISQWRLTLPKNFPLFDYKTINDVSLRLSYTAEHDEAWGQKVEQANGAMAESLHKYLLSSGLPRLLSLRHDFPDVWYQLVTSPAGTVITLELTERHLPYLFDRLKQQNTSLQTTSVDVTLQTDLVPTVELDFDGSKLAPAPSGATASSANWSPVTKGLYRATISNVTILGTHTLKIVSAGNLAKPSGGASGTIDTTKLADLLLRMDLRLAG